MPNEEQIPTPLLTEMDKVIPEFEQLFFKTRKFRREEKQELMLSYILKKMKIAYEAKED